MDDAAKLGYDLCEAIYAATRVGQGQVGDTKRCEVKPNTVAKLIGALRPGGRLWELRAAIDGGQVWPEMAINGQKILPSISSIRYHRA